MADFEPRDEPRADALQSFRESVETTDVAKPVPPLRRAGSESWVDRLTPDDLRSLDDFDRRLVVEELRWRSARHAQLEQSVAAISMLTMVAISRLKEVEHRGLADSHGLAENGFASLNGRVGSLMASSIARAAGDVASRRREVLLRLRDAIERDDKDEALGLAAELVGVAPR